MTALSTVRRAMRFLGGNAEAATHAVQAPTVSTADAPLAEHDGFEPASCEAPELAAVERLLEVLQNEPKDIFQLPRRKRSRRVAVEETSTLQAWALQPLPNMPAADSRSGFLAWTFLALGLMAFACGAVMLGWSVATQREELWTLGIPLVLGGQAAMLFGMIGLVESANQRSKQVTVALEEHRQRLGMMQNMALASQASPHKRAA